MYLLYAKCARVWGWGGGLFTCMCVGGGDCLVVCGGGGWAGVGGGGVCVVNSAQRSEDLV